MKRGRLGPDGFGGREGEDVADSPAFRFSGFASPLEAGDGAIGDGAAAAGPGVGAAGVPGAGDACALMGEGAAGEARCWACGVGCGGCCCCC